MTRIIGFESASAEAPRFRFLNDGEELAMLSTFVAREEGEDVDDTDVGVVFGEIRVTKGTLTDLPEGLGVFVDSSLEALLIAQDDVCVAARIRGTHIPTVRTGFQV